MVERRRLLMWKTDIDFGAARVTGVDIDEHLVEQARSHISFRCSRLPPSSHLTPRDSEYFPVSALLSYGHRHTLQAGNVSFAAEDWLFSDNPQTSGPFDIIVAFSVTKWIHLQHLDRGIRMFFKKCADSLSEDGQLILEAQPWASYQKAVRRSKSPHFAPNLHQLQLRPDGFADLLELHGLRHVRTSNQLSRPIAMFCKTRSTALHNP